MRYVAWVVFLLIVGMLANRQTISNLFRDLSGLGGGLGGPPEIPQPEIGQPEGSMAGLTGLIVIVVIVILALVTLFKTARVVPEYQRLVVFRLGRALPQPKGPGLVLLIPWVDNPRVADLRERFHEIPAQSAITKDNAPVSVDFLIYRRVVDPYASIVSVEDFQGAAEGIAKTTLRSVVGDISLDDVLSRREHMNEIMRDKLDEVTERWGVKVTAVEVREIQPPHDIQEAMSRQMSAERNRRAVVLEADGKREATIAVAEGDKQSAILRAEGERQSAILRAEGFSEALQRIFSAARGVDEKTMALQYLDTLKALGASPATKFVLPMEFTSLLRPLVALTTTAAGGSSTTET